MNAPSVDRDERTTAVENAGYRWSYLVLSFGLLTAVGVRSFARGEASWDLLALVLLGGAVNTAYQLWHRVVYRRWIVIALLTLVAAAAMAALMAALPLEAQAPAQARNDSLLACGERVAATAGFRVAPGRRRDRVALMRPRDLGLPQSTADGLRLVVRPDTAGMDVSAKIFLQSRVTGLGQGEMSPDSALLLVVTSIRRQCR